MAGFNFGLSGLSGVYGGYLQGQEANNQLQLQQQQIQENKLKAQAAQLDYAANATAANTAAALGEDLSQLGTDYGVSTAPQPQQMSPGQPSVPMIQPTAPQPTSASVAPQPSTAPQPLVTTSGGLPVQPPGGYLNPSASAQPATAPQRAPVASTAPTQPLAPPAPNATAPAQPSIIAPPNATVQPVQNVPAPQSSPPGSFVGTTNAQPGQQVQFNGQTYMVAQKDQRTGRALMVPARNPPVASSAQQQIVQRANTARGASVMNATAGRWDLGTLARQIIRANPGIEKNPQLLFATIGKVQHMLTPDAKVEFQLLQLQNKEQIADMQAQNRLDVANLRGDIMQSLAQSRFANQTTQQAGRNSQQVRMAAVRAGIDPEGKSDDELMAETAQKLDAKNSQAVMDDDTAKDYAQAAVTDPSLLAHLGYGAAGTANRAKVLKYYFSELDKRNLDPSAEGQQKITMAGATSGERTASTQAAKIDIGLKEINEFAPMVRASSAKVDRTKYPTVNSIMEAAQKGTGGTAIVTFANNLAALKNAYALVLARGGQITDEARRQASETIDKAYSDGQINAALDAILAEGNAAKKAATGAQSEISQSVAAPSARSASPSSSAETGGVQAGRDARIQQGLKLDAQIQALNAGPQTPKTAGQILDLQNKKVALAQQDARAMDTAKRAGVDIKKYGKFSDALNEARGKSRGAPARRPAPQSAQPGQATGTGTKDDPIVVQSQDDVDNAPSGAYLSINGTTYKKP